MHVLVSGAFGNIGQAALESLLHHGHHLTAFDTPTRRNRHAARRFRGRVRVCWGDIRDPQAVARAVAGQDAVVHLAFVIPNLSATGKGSEEAPDWAWAVNVGGTRNLIAAMEAQPRPPRLVFTSSLHIYGRTQHLPPPRRVDDPPNPAEHYSRHKAAAEALVKGSTLKWVIFRLAAALPVTLILDPGMFDVPLNNRIEFVHREDVAIAIAHAVTSEAVWGKVLHIGGGPRCQHLYHEVAERILVTVGVGMLPEEAFSRTPYPVDWLDTEESERLLRYQQRTLDDYLADLRRALGWRRGLVRAFRPFVRWLLLRRSPYLDRATAWRLA
ncbi:MAG TPA: NAD(P)-dependent oxidoreductase [Anaerolineae bacterium]|nr:NAD(P)-dependent oxidoreductase [Anaerolineae bacterium]HID84831.1 NAD(P)-dependent oxidoreductase [Anaerolineales bacterium]HIQ09000.1 NAD(P)-dependent oxidoreductase [Anaerolineaceae bacterium]